MHYQIHRDECDSAWSDPAALLEGALPAFGAGEPCLLFARRRAAALTGWRTLAGWSAALARGRGLTRRGAALAWRGSPVSRRLERTRERLGRTGLERAVQYFDSGEQIALEGGRAELRRLVRPTCRPALGCPGSLVGRLVRRGQLTCRQCANENRNQEAEARNHVPSVHWTTSRESPATEQDRSILWITESSTDFGIPEVCNRFHSVASFVNSPRDGKSPGELRTGNAIRGNRHRRRDTVAHRRDFLKATTIGFDSRRRGSIGEARHQTGCRSVNPEAHTKLVP
jgi:hypothetical protein